MRSERPGGNTVIEEGDTLLILTMNDTAEAVRHTIMGCEDTGTEDTEPPEEGWSWGSGFRWGNAKKP